MDCDFVRRRGRDETFHGVRIPPRKTRTPETFNDFRYEITSDLTSFAFWPVSVAPFVHVCIRYRQITEDTKKANHIAASRVGLAAKSVQNCPAVAPIVAIFCRPP
jgi:hypothetical protein